MKKKKQKISELNTNTSVIEDKPRDLKKSVKRLLSYVFTQKKLLIIVFFLVLFSTVLSVASSLLMQPVYEAIENVTVHGGDPNSAMSKIIKALFAMGFAFVLSSIMSYAYQRIMLSASVNVLTDMRRDLFNHLQTLPISFFDREQTGQVMSRFTNDVGRISDLVSNTFVTLITNVITAIMTIVIMFIYSWQISLIAIVCIVLMVAVIVGITKLCDPLYKKQQETLASCNGYIEEYIKGIKVVKVFGHESKTKSEFSKINETYRKVGIKANIIGGIASPIVSMIMRINYAVAILLGAVKVINGKMEIPQLITYLQYVNSYGSPVVSIAGTYQTLISALAGAERVFDVLDTESETDDGKIELVQLINDQMSDNTNQFVWRKTTDKGEVIDTPVKGNIEIDDVSFSYVPEKEVLHHITANARSGEKLAFVGSTGAGKTTITNLINRFYDIENGSIKIDGININDIKKPSLRNSMAFVLQDSVLFEGTIRENIRYGRLDATDQEVEDAAKIANAYDFIMSQKNGFDTVVKADGVNLSAGQAQLINIARAAVSNRPILVLDEATSSVDTMTESVVEKAMDGIMKNCTVLVIAHRLSTVKNSKDIAVIENGEIIEEGSHDELIEKHGRYYKLYTGTAVLD